MATTVPQAFHEFAGKLQLTATQEATVASRKTNAGAILGGLFDSSTNMPLTGAYLIGSAARQTIIRPLDDIDLFVIFDDTMVWDTYRLDSRKLLYRVRDALANNYRVNVVGARGQAVRLFYTAAPSVDITPAFPVTIGGGYVIPAGDGSWIQTDPFVHNRFVADRNRVLGGYLKPLVRHLKRWNNVHSGRFKSFHLEMVAQATFLTLGGSTRGGLRDFFDAAPSQLDVSDPAGYSGILSAGWSWSHRNAVIDSLAASRDRAVRALDADAAGNPSEAARLWRIVLGSEFPTL